ncbi:MAG: cytochrome c biogenesis protein ResB [Puniceicoccales bacterium]|jgi:hypothetical protein|nr:cytochrome c biogenesis protein ResB [Puniceicoccales bacterium]
MNWQGWIFNGPASSGGTGTTGGTTGGGVFRRALRALASLRLTVALLALSCVLVTLATLDMHWNEIHRAQRHYFEAWGALFPMSPEASGAPAWARLPLPGGLLLGVALLANLVFAFGRYFRARWRNAGVALVHLGVVVLLAGGFVTSKTREEFTLSIAEGGTGGELVSDAFERDKDAYIAAQQGAQSYAEAFAKVTAAARARGLTRKLGFELRLEKFIHERHPGTDIPSRFASRVVVLDNAGGGAGGDGATGSGTGSGVTAGGVPFEISMNRPLYHGGYTFYQSSWRTEADGRQITILQVVRNAGWWLPYAAMWLIGGGMLLQFLLSLLRFLRRR